MPSTFAEIRTTVREFLNEDTASFWSEQELLDILTKGAKDLWRDVTDLKQEHYLRINDTDVYLPANGTQLAGVPQDVHKVYLIEPRDVSAAGEQRMIFFTPREYNHVDFRGARTNGTVNPPYGEFFYAVLEAGSPAGPPVIRVGPSPSADINVTLAYVPTLDAMWAESPIPIPGEPDNALVAWGIAYARAKEREDRSVDPNWIAVYKTEKEHLLHSLGMRQYQEPQITDGIFDALW